MKCVVLDCPKDAEYPFRCCDSFHGKLLNTIGSYLNNTDPKYEKFLLNAVLGMLDFGHPKELTDEERKYYLTVIKK